MGEIVGYKHFINEQLTFLHRRNMSVAGDEIGKFCEPVHGYHVRVEA